MTTDKHIDFVYNFFEEVKKSGIKLGFDRILKLLSLLDNPQDKLNVVHIAGTNGKGTTASFITSILRQKGLNVGVFNSPHILRINEIIKFNDTEISDSELFDITFKIKEVCDNNFDEANYPTEFEIITSIMFYYFAYVVNCDIVVLEVGLGGKDDTTNVIKNAKVSVITKIAIDHANILGNSLSEIATHKVGIVKQNGHVVFYPQEKNVEDLIINKCNELNSTYNTFDTDDINVKVNDLTGQTFDFLGFKDLYITLLGAHQVYNASLAILSVLELNKQGYNITEQDIRQGLKNTKWQSRFEIISDNPVIICDGSHNLDGVVALRKSLDTYFLGKKFIFIFGVLKDKDYEEMIAVFKDLDAKFYITTPKNDRACNLQTVSAILNKYNIKNEPLNDNLFDIIKNANDEIICTFGSFYVVNYIRDSIMNTHS